MLLRDGAPVPLAPKAIRTLLTLVERAGEVVTKQQLLETVWPDSFVEDTGLTRNISVIRQVFGEDERFIATVARLGYRFTAPVAWIESSIKPPLSRAGGATRNDRQVRMVGRTEELNALRSAFEDVVIGSGRMIAVTGEPGIGKTTVVETFLKEIEEQCRIGSGRCSERLASAEPHLPILEALDELTGRDAQMMQILSARAPTWLRHVVPRSPEHTRAYEGGEPDPARTSERLMRELTTFLEEASSQTPVTIVVEDLHWTDLSTVDVLVHLAARLSRLHLLLIVTYRHHELALRDHPFVRVRAELISRGQLQEMAVSLLTPDEVREYVLSAFEGEDVATDLPALVFEKTEGNPLFMADLVRYFQKRGSSIGRVRTVLDVPDSLRVLIDRTLHGLPPAARQVASIAAVQGYEFDSATLARVSGMPASDVEELLGRLGDVHALVALERETALPDGTLTLVYRFVHVLYQDALVESIAPSKRSEWARRIAEALMLSHTAQTDHIAGQLAALFETGRDFWQASQHFLAASRTATQRFAFREAIDLATRGLNCLNAASGVEQSHRLQRELDLAFARLVPVSSVEGYASVEAEKISARLVELGEALNDAPATAAALSATWMIRIVRGDCAAAKDAGTRLVALAHASSNDVLLMNAHMHAQIACHHLGEFAEAREHCAAAVSLVPRTSSVARRIMMFDPIAASLAESSRNFWITGHLARCVDDAETAVRIGRELRHPDSLAFALAFHGWLHGHRREWATCLASTDAGIATARESDSVQTLAWNRCVHGWGAAHAGAIEEGRVELSDGIDASTAIMGQVALPQFYAMMAEVLLLESDVRAAIEWVDRAISLMNENADLYFAAEVYRLAGRCEREVNNIDAALAHLRRAIGLARLQGAKFFELRAALDLADLKTDERGVVAAALDGFPEPEPWPEVIRARAVIG